MKSFILPSILASATFTTRALAAPTESCVNSAICANTVCTTQGAAHIIVTRASTEAPGTGIIGAIANATVSACPGSDIVANPYPALLDSASYGLSETEGIGNLTQLVANYTRCCPTSKIVLLGYSQGAQVTSDFLCGRSELGFTPTAPLGVVYNSQIAAVILMGDPSYVKGLSYDVGSAGNVSVFPRIDNLACLPVADRIRSYCDNNDYFCDSGTSIAVHEGYVQEYGVAATQFVISKIPGCSK